ncbi:DUF2760 domain-containing protein [Neptunomonas qingdaonensis]|uniref:DUF2760 domain-containing protein n=1 Tax=Neptunomonas qingdaonensis TaxID=1045558 RepID=UPI001E2EE8D5|nr:DUF2760 domain-containing protein [Neptunomonas qingdaonensis]
MIPVAFDALHLLLLVLALLLFVSLMRKPADVNAKPAEQPSAPVEPAATPSVLKDTTPESALQLLSLLQQDARFLDFVHEDLSSYSDADIGAAARVVHEGSKKTIAGYFTLSPIRTEEEESRLTLESGFDASQVRLTGNVVGSAPFTGTLVHRGWKATQVRLPQLAKGHDVRILAPAEVEL